jgi:diaminopimelate decarboxylase
MNTAERKTNMNFAPQNPKLRLFPQATAIDLHGHLTIRGHRASDLVAQFGSPQYVYDVGAIRSQIAAYRRALAQYPGPAPIDLRRQSFSVLVSARLMTEDSVGLDVASAGELFIAQRGGADPMLMHLHSNNTTRLD